MKEREISLLNHGVVQLLRYKGNDTSLSERVREYQAAQIPTMNLEENRERFFNALIRGNKALLGSYKLSFMIYAPMFVLQEFPTWSTYITSSTSCSEHYLPEALSGEEEKQSSLSDLEWISFSSGVAFDSLVRAGVPRREARIVLLQNFYALFFWETDLLEVLKISLQIRRNRQRFEVQEYLNGIVSLVLKWTSLGDEYDYSS